MKNLILNYQFYGWLFDLIFKMRTMGYIQELGPFIFENHIFES
jgi:hypothetical protein